MALSRIGARLLGALMAGALVSVSAGLGASSASAQARRDVQVSPQAWKVQKSYPPVIDEVAGLSCPTTSDCWAAGTTPSDAGEIVASTSGGSTWTSEAAMDGLHYLRAISCPTTTRCWAVGYDTGENLGIPTFRAGVVVTTDGGKTWKRQRLPNGTSILSGLSCPTATKCWAVGDSGALADDDPAVVTTNSHGRWTTESVPRAVFVLWDVSCPTSQVCWAIGETRSSQAPIVVATTDGGRTWRTKVEPRRIAAAYILSCPTATDCVVSGTTTSGAGIVTATENGGRTWATSLVGGFSDPTGVSCPTPDDCWMVGTEASPDAGADVVVTTNGGRTWKTQRLPNPLAPSGLLELTNVSCRTPCRCWIVGSTHTGAPGAAVTADGGRTWTPESFPAGFLKFGAISCGTVGHCWTVGSASNGVAIEASIDGGRAWDRQHIPPQIEILSDLTCVGAHDCWAVGSGEHGASLAPRPTEATCGRLAACREASAT